MFGNKKIKILIAVFVILILGAGGFFWWQYRETPIEKWETAKISPEEDYIIEETFEGKMVENKKMGLSYKIPQDWILEDGNPTRFYSPDAEFGEESSIFLEKGCKIDIYASYIKTNLDTLKKFIDAEFLKSSLVTKVDEFSIIKVSNYSALKHKYRLDKFGISSILVDFPSKDELYRILLSSPIGEKERCEEELNKFLEIVQIQ